MTAEAIAVKALREYLLANLPARVALLNAANFASLRAAWPGPYVVPGATSLTVASSRGGSGSAVLLTSGTRTAAQVATDINDGAPVSGVVASADSSGRLVLTASIAPQVGAAVAADTPSVVAVHAGAINSVFGWELGGESVVTSAIRPPRHRHLRDGWPTRPPDGAAGAMWVIIGDRQTTLVPDTKQQRDEYLVEVSADIFVPCGTVDERTRERITTAVRAVREVVTGGGRSLGAFNDGLLLCRLMRTRIAGMPFSFENDNSPNQLFDAASLTFGLRVFVAPIS